MTPTNQLSLLSGAPTTPPVVSPTPAPVSYKFDTVDTLLLEIAHDWWGLLDPRNWRTPGPTDEEILARYRAAGSPQYNTWPIVSGHRLYTHTWPALRLTHHLSDDRLLTACQTCRSHHLPKALDTLRANTIEYSLVHDLIRQRIWNGDSWTSYLALSTFAQRPAHPLTSLIPLALERTLHHTIASYHTALAERFRTPAMSSPRSTRSPAKDPRNALEATITSLRHTLATLRRHQRSPHPLRSLFEHATIGPRFSDPAWSQISTGDPLPPDLIAHLIRE